MYVGSGMLVKIMGDSSLSEEYDRGRDIATHLFGKVVREMPYCLVLESQ